MIPSRSGSGWALACVLLFAGCASNQPSIRTYQDDDATFGEYETIAFGGPGKMPKGYTRGKLPERLVPIARDVVYSTFEAKGYRIVDDVEAADLVLVGGVGAKEKTIQNPSPARDAGTFSVAMPEMKVATGAIALDVFARETGRAVWGGTLEAVMKQQPVEPENFRSALQSLLDRFPARSAE